MKSKQNRIRNRKKEEEYLGGMSTQLYRKGVKYVN